MFAAATEKGKLSTLPELIGLILYQPGHVGVYIGNGWIIHARGFSYGVVLAKVSEGNWTDWFKCPYIDYIDNADRYEESPLWHEGVLEDMLRILSYTKGTTMMRGADVTHAQELLNTMGFEPGKVDGIFGPSTEAAVKAFQRDVDLPVTGAIDEQTWEVLMAVQDIEDDLDPSEYDTEMDVEDTDPSEMESEQVGGFELSRLLKYVSGKAMMRGEDVKAVQERLSQLVFGVGNIDGIYGPRTVAAVRAFQVSVGIDDDGIVGPITMHFLFN